MSGRKTNIALLIVYSALMVWLLFDRAGYVAGVPYWEQVSQQLNLVPFRTLRLFINLLDSGVRSYILMAVINLAGNVILFIPLGFLLPRVFPWCDSLLRQIFITAAIITTVEILQLFTLVGSCDIDDLILNVIGSTFGFLIHKHAKKPAP